jgi:hypothetical protein
MHLTKMTGPGMIIQKTKYFFDKEYKKQLSIWVNSLDRDFLIISEAVN